MTRLRALAAEHRPAILLSLFVAAHVVLAVATSPTVAATVAIVETAVLAWTFVVVYAARRAWHRTETGRLVMGLGVFLALLTTVSLLPLSGLFGEWIALLILTGMASITLTLVRLLIVGGRDT